MYAVLSATTLHAERLGDFWNTTETESKAYPVVDIPIPDLLLRLRDRGKREGARKAMAGTPPMGVWSLLASSPAAWETALKMGFALDYLPSEVIPVPALRAWQSVRKLPPWRGGKFRRWMRERGGDEQ